MPLKLVSSRFILPRYPCLLLSLNITSTVRFLLPFSVYRARKELSKLKKGPSLITTGAVLGHGLVRKLIYRYLLLIRKSLLFAHRTPLFVRRTLLLLLPLYLQILASRKLVPHFLLLLLLLLFLLPGRPLPISSPALSPTASPLYTTV
ncbi:hypothetical protein F5882DRAFT_409916, partial [Hyaloscypha sp. PMI_1271]